MVAFLQKDKPFLLRSLFLRIRYAKNSYQLFLSAHVIRSIEIADRKVCFFSFLWTDEGVHPPRVSLRLYGFERLKHSRSAREDMPRFHYSLFLRIRYDKNSYQLFLSAHVIRSKRKNTRKGRSFLIFQYSNIYSCKRLSFMI